MHTTTHRAARRNDVFWDLVAWMLILAATVGFWVAFAALLWILWP